MKGITILKSLAISLIGIPIAMAVIVVIGLTASNSELMYFVAGCIVSLIILSFVWAVDKESNKEINEKLDSIIAKLGIEGNTESLKKDVRIGTTRENIEQEVQELICENQSRFAKYRQILLENLRSN